MSARALFLLSPASTSGRRARILLSSPARFELAERVRSSAGAPIGEVFSFLSGLYFRGKLGYARRFAQSPRAVRIITSDRGLVAPELSVTVADLTAMAASAIDGDNARYTGPVQRDAASLAASLGPGDRVVLLGSIATGKYADLLRPALADQLVFPGEFVGRGDMSRGGLLLRAVDAEERREEASPSSLLAIRYSLWRASSLPVTVVRDLFRMMSSLKLSPSS